MLYRNCDTLKVPRWGKLPVRTRIQKKRGGRRKRVRRRRLGQLVGGGREYGELGFRGRF